MCFPGDVSLDAIKDIDRANKSTYGNVVNTQIKLNQNMASKNKQRD